LFLQHFSGNLDFGLDPQCAETYDQPSHQFDAKLVFCLATKTAVCIAPARGLEPSWFSCDRGSVFGVVCACPAV